jgi:hypothetical protein
MKPKEVDRLKLDEKMQPIQWTEWPTGALAGGGSVSSHVLAPSPHHLLLRTTLLVTDRRDRDSRRAEGIIKLHKQKILKP